MLGCGLSRWPCLTFKTSAGLNLDTITVRRSLFRMNVRASEHSSKNWIADAGKAAHLSPEQRHLQVVLVSPQIPGNTGAIARSCAATLVGLHLVEPLGFSIDSAKLKRAGLDYWPYVVVKVHGSWAEFLEFFKNQKGEKRLIAYTKRANHMYTDKSYQYGDWLLFGSETNGLPAEAIEECCSGQYAGGTVRIPMNDTYVRSLNLAVSASIGIYEAIRQLEIQGSFEVESLSNFQDAEYTAIMSENDGFP